MQTQAATKEQGPGRVRQGFASLLQGAFFVGYPLAVYFASTRLETRSMAVGLLAFYAVATALRFRGSASELWDLVRAHIALPILIGAAVATGNRTILLFLPVAVNLYMLWAFASSLFPGPPIVERFARLAEDDLPDFTLPYCRKLTIVWCVFFVFNATMTAALALGAPVAWWALFSGLISYGLVGTLFVGELLFRKLWFRHYGDGTVDRLVSRLFPPERTANGRRSLAYIANRGAPSQELRNYHCGNE